MADESEIDAARREVKELRAQLQSMVDGLAESNAAASNVEPQEPTWEERARQAYPDGPPIGVERHVHRDFTGFGVQRGRLLSGYTQRF